MGEGAFFFFFLPFFFFLSFLCVGVVLAFLNIVYPAASLKSPQLVAGEAFLGDQSWNGGSV